MSRLILGVLTFLALLGGTTHVSADKPGTPETYLTYSSDKKFVFVMLWRGDKHPLYSESGLYPNDGNQKPLWTVDGFYWNARNKFVVAADGKHLVRIQTWPALTKQRTPADKNSLEAVGLEVFANGKLVRSIKLKELVDRPELLSNSVTGFFWVQTEKFDDAKLNYRIDTRDGNRIDLDVRTAKITKEKTP